MGRKRQLVVHLCFMTHPHEICYSQIMPAYVIFGHFAQFVLAVLITNAKQCWGKKIPEDKDVSLLFSVAFSFFLLSVFSSCS